MRNDAQIATDVNRQVGQKVACSDAQIANRRAAQRIAHNNAQIALESVARANA
jgi:hypothetical protein